MIGVRERGRETTGRDLCLLRRLLDHETSGAGSGRPVAGLGQLAAAREAPEELPRLGDDVRAADLAADGEHDALGPVELTVPGDDRGVVDALQRLRRAQRGQAVRVESVGRGVQLVEGAGHRVVALTLDT